MPYISRGWTKVMVPSSSLSKVSPGLPRSLQFAGGNGALAKKNIFPEKRGENEWTYQTKTKKYSTSDGSKW